MASENRPRGKAQRDAARSGGLAKARRARETDRANRAKNADAIQRRETKRKERQYQLSKGGKKKINAAAGDKKGCAVTAILVGTGIVTALGTWRGWA